MSTVGELLVKIGVDLKPLHAGIAQAESEMKLLEGAGAKGATGIGHVGKAAAVAGAAVAAGTAFIGVEAVKAAAKFNDSMTLIQTQAGASAADVNAFKGQVLDLATVVPQGPDALAAGLYHVVSAGYSGKQAMDVLKLAAEGAATGHADLESTTNALIASLKSGVGGITDASQAMGVLNSVVGAGNMRMQDLTDAMGTGVLSTAKNYGVTMQDVGAAMASMTTQGIPAIDAATRLNSAMRLMAAPTSQAQKALASIGLSSTSLANDMRKPNGLLLALTDLKTHMATGVPSAVKQMVTSIEASSKSPAAAVAKITKELSGMGLSAGQIADAIHGKFSKIGLSATQQAALIAHAFGGKQSGAILTLAGNLDLFKQKEDLVAQGTGGFADAWATTAEDTTTQANQMKATFDSMMVSIGEGLIPAVNQIVQAIAPVLKGMADWARQNPQLAGLILVVVGALGALAAAAAVIAPIIGAIGAVVGIAFSPVIIVIGLIIAAVVLLVTHFEQFKAGVGVVVNFVGGVISGLLGIVGGVFSGIASWLGSLVSDFQTGWNTVATAVTNVWNTITGLVGQAMAFIGDLIGKGIDFLVTLFVRIPIRIAIWEREIVGQAIRLGIQVLQAVTRFVGQVVQFILSIPGKIADLVGRVVNTFVQIGSQVFSTVVGMVTSIVNLILGIPGKIGDLVGSFADIAGKAVTAFVNVIAGLPGKVAGIIGNVGSTIGNAISSVIPHFASGSWSVPRTTLAVVHEGEMIIPATQAADVRSGRGRVAATAASGALGSAAASPRRTAEGARGAPITVNVYNPAPEPPSTSVRREVAKLQQLTAFGY